MTAKLKLLKIRRQHKGEFISVKMQEIERSNNWVRLSWLKALLADAGIQAVILDSHTAIAQGSIDMLPQRLMVLDEELERARYVLKTAGECQD